MTSQGTDQFVQRLKEHSDVAEVVSVPFGEGRDLMFVELHPGRRTRSVDLASFATPNGTPPAHVVVVDEVPRTPALRENLLLPFQIGIAIPYTSD